MREERREGSSKELSDVEKLRKKVSEDEKRDLKEAGSEGKVEANELRRRSGKQDAVYPPHTVNDSSYRMTRSFFKRLQL